MIMKSEKCFRIDVDKLFCIPSDRFDTKSPDGGKKGSKTREKKEK